MTHTYPPITAETFDRDRLMRSWAQDGFLVELYETNQPTSRYGHTSVAYRFYDFDWEQAGNGELALIFAGTDYAVPAQQSLDGDESVRGILGFLSCGEHDVEDEFFAHYTPRQTAWRDDRAEALSWWAMDNVDLDTGAVPEG